MKLKIVLFTLVFLLLNVPTGFAEDTASYGIEDKCGLPQKPAIPEGSSVTEEEIDRRTIDCKTYMVQGNNYLECIIKVEEDWGEAVTPEQQALVTALHNRIVDDMEVIASLFNSAIRAYKEKNP